ncbi:MAG: electron transport complex subunit RsxC [Muribaculum sp.]|nr:electron transport complex subunit RsxC [Muribaculum sp.]
MLTFRKGGVHPPENKLTAGHPIVDVDLPREVTIAMSQHIGVPAVCIVKKGDHVSRGEMVGRAETFMSANAFTPISGTVIRVDKVKNSFGIPVDSVTIVASETDNAEDSESELWNEPMRSSDELDSLSADKVVEIIGDAGIVGLGGAAFPTRVKLSPPHGKKADILVINGAECEPYLTNDHALMLSYPSELLTGIRLLMRAAKVDDAIVGIEANKRDAIEILSSHLKADSSIRIVELKTKYPQGGEKQLIKALTGRVVPAGGLPVYVGVIVQNVATAYAVYEAVVFGKPLVDRLVTVTGPTLTNPGNYKVPVGMSILKLIDLAGGIPDDTGKVIIGGPMMGRTAIEIDSPTMKNVSGILLLPESQSRRGPVMPCIRCAQCVSACPMGLEPYLLSLLSSRAMWSIVEERGVMNCIECGCCSYTCPASRPLLDYIRLGKSTVGGIIRSRSAKKY